MADSHETSEAHAVLARKAIFPFYKLPPELRDQIYHHIFSLSDPRSQRALRIERRSLKYFSPTPTFLLLTLHHESVLLSRQTAREALEILFKHHTVFLSCGPFVLHTLLQRIERDNGPGRQWLRWIKDVELDWVTFPNLRVYPPDREEWDGEQADDAYEYEYDDEEEVDVDYMRGAAHNGPHHYNDNSHTRHDIPLPPPPHNPLDPFALAPPTLVTHPPPPPRAPTPRATTNLALLISTEVTPLFAYLASPAMTLTRLTLPLYFTAAQTALDRRVALPLKIRYWVQVCVHALLMLVVPARETALQSVRVRYLPWDVWASMEPADDLGRMGEEGVWFDGGEEEDGGEREGEGAAFRAVWAEMRARVGEGRARMGLEAQVRFVPWDGNVDSWRVGDELEVLFTRGHGGEA